MVTAANWISSRSATRHPTASTDLSTYDFRLPSTNLPTHPSSYSPPYSPTRSLTYASISFESLVVAKALRTLVSWLHLNVRRADVVTFRRSLRTEAAAFARRPLSPTAATAVAAACPAAAAALNYDTPTHASHASLPHSFASRNTVPTLPVAFLKPATASAFYYCPVQLAASRAIFESFALLTKSRSGARPCYFSQARGVPSALGPLSPFRVISAQSNAFKLTSSSPRTTPRGADTSAAAALDSASTTFSGDTAAAVTDAAAAATVLLCHPFSLTDARNESRAVNAAKRQRKLRLRHTSFLVVRNPFGRLVSAYLRYFLRGGERTTDRSVAQYRSWIRDFHRIPEGSPLTFSHFVRWVVQLHPDDMHPAWQPYTHACNLRQIKYSFVVRLERFDEDFSALLKRIGVSDSEEKLIRVTAARRRPQLALDHPERYALWRLLYSSDDSRDLQLLVAKRYRNDLASFGYGFPHENGSIQSIGLGGFGRRK